MKIKSLFFALGLSVILLSGLSGCVASAGVGPDYGYYPPVRRYYPPRPVVVVPAPYYRRPAYRPAYPPAYRPAYRSRNDGHRDSGYRGNSNGGYQGRRGGRY